MDGPTDRDVVGLKGANWIVLILNSNLHVVALDLEFNWSAPRSSPKSK